MPLQFDTVNYLAVLVAGVVVFFIGGVWYQALFGKTWVKLHGYTQEDVQRMQKARPPVVFFGTMVAAYLVMCFAGALLVTALDLRTVVAGMTLGGLLWLVVAAINMTAHITTEKPIALYAIDTTYQFVIFLVAGAILASWR
ncbi:MAG TPA: DUF1761 domain-containing protein [Phycisphaerales bacterium]|nr:DUF1761 domain-containing protein [Phycisphaerales bacterium]HRQ74952.1 DUF1761 domain-containing protein [Phycisphaerales bacterium]